MLSESQEINWIWKPHTKGILVALTTHWPVGAVGGGRNPDQGPNSCPQFRGGHCGRHAGQAGGSHLYRPAQPQVGQAEWPDRRDIGEVGSIPLGVMVYQQNVAHLDHHGSA